MKIDLFLAGKKGLVVLKYLCDSPYRKLIRHVITASDNAVQEDNVAALQEVCRTQGIPFFDRSVYKEEGADGGYRFLIGWRWITGKGNTIVLHDSLLPSYRGFAPLVNALINGEPETGVTAFRAADEYDTGPVLAQRKMMIAHPMRIEDAINAISELYVGVMDVLLKDLEKGGEPAGVQQDESAATYSLWRDEADYFINWEEDSDRILRTIYALSFPYRGARALLNGEEIIIKDAVTVADVTIVNRQPGKVIFVADGCPVVVCGKGLLKVISASRSRDNTAVLPLKKFRSRFS